MASVRQKAAPTKAQAFGIRRPAPRRSGVSVRPLLIALEGPSGAGKTTVARVAARRYDWDVLPEAYERLAPTVDLAYAGASELLRLERQLLAEEHRRYRRAGAARRNGRTVILDTGFFGPLTYTAGLVALRLAPRRTLDALLAAAGSAGRHRSLGLPDAVVYLELPEPQLRHRIARDPAGHPPDLAPRHLAVGRFEHALYRGPLAEVLEGRIAFVPASGAPDRVARRVAAAVRRLPIEGSRRGVRERLIERIRSAATSGTLRRPRASAATVKKPARSARAPSR
jgi:thymidylate kinase